MSVLRIVDVVACRSRYIVLERGEAASLFALVWWSNLCQRFLYFSVSRICFLYSFVRLSIRLCRSLRTCLHATPITPWLIYIYIIHWQAWWRSGHIVQMFFSFFHFFSVTRPLDFPITTNMTFLPFGQISNRLSMRISCQFSSLPSLLFFLYMFGTPFWICITPCSIQTLFFRSR